MTASQDPIIVQARDLAFQWPGADHCLHFPDLRLHANEHLFLRGPSGSGKSTLLSMLAGLSLPERGELRLQDTALTGLSRRARDRLRADRLGVIFQQFNLVPYLSVIDNVTLPCRLSKPRAGRATPSPETEARHLLAALDVTEDLWQRPVTRLSVGQQQRVACARALIGRPILVLADEPTSALDADNRDRFLQLLISQCRASGAALVFVSHDASLADAFDRTLDLGETVRTETTA
ncbi:ABC transporter ATP-binding protein [Marinobacter nanhaiticus D15-8W]|uniref:ATP-binding cassette domain-containing protein n=1 Tax=Marinobacter nanhaiticus D15-8W TaxID=626887 RepID=N6X432_9GAMM|nr:ATP-binding cassette domain-containing protein [Marinobacter nanhaiticus]ENO15843.1 ATP-binding cassette domain-containing protein [Marinobacter nanhaiticus D15-8W]BES73300.1 ABC transporter ATP-binding protein [Marinobacter nanhaiticus D15-8W]